MKDKKSLVLNVWSVKNAWGGGITTMKLSRHQLTFLEIYQTKEEAELEINTNPYKRDCSIQKGKITIEYV